MQVLLSILKRDCRVWLSVRLKMEWIMYVECATIVHYTVTKRQLIKMNVICTNKKNELNNFTPGFTLSLINM